MFSLEPLEPRRLCSTTRTLFITDRTFAADASREALEVVGLRRPIHFVGCTFAGGSTSCRINRVENVTFEHCQFKGPFGPADPDGSCLQLIDCGLCRVSGCAFEASKGSEDLLSIFCDDPDLACRAIIEDCYFHGKGASESGNAICLDGPVACHADFSNLRFVHSRCAITIANASDVTLDAVAFIRTGTGVYRHDFYQGANPH